MKTYLNEWDKNACNVLREHFPESVVDQRSIADVTAEDVKQYQQCHFFAGIGGFSLGLRNTTANVWTGGFPCQDLSIAGKREGLAGSRSGYYFEFHRLITSSYPELVVLENVPGLLSSNKGKDFAIVVGGLTGIIPEVPETGWGNAGFFRGPVYSVAYRILDAQFFGVPQRRRRVFIVASFGNGRAAQVLFESEGLSGNTPPRRETREGTAGTFTIRSGKDGGGKGYLGQASLAMTLGGQEQYLDNTGISSTLRSGAGAIKHEADALGRLVFDRQRSDEYGEADTVSTVSARDYKSASDLIAYNIQHNDGFVGVRRLTPLECERLQGFPDGWTEGQSDTQRYKQLGNAVAVPVIEWIGKRIMAVK